jgi:hypothetical protein
MNKYSRIAIFLLALICLLGCPPPTGQTEGAPTAVADANPKTVSTAGATVTLSSTGSSAGAGYTASYKWTCPRAGVVIADSTAASTTATIPGAAFDYVFTLTVANVGGTKQATDNVTVTSTYVSAEEAPTAVADANPKTVSTAGATVTLSSTGSSAGAGYTPSYHWTCPSAGITIASPNAASTTATIPGTAGDYVFTLTVGNVEGAMQASANAKVTSTYGTTKTADDYVNDGIAYLSKQDFNSARVAFATALSLDANHTAAKVWKAFLDLAGTAVNSDIVSLYKDDMGFTDYPSDLNKLLSDSWFTKQYYNASYEYVEVSSTAGYRSIYLRGTATPALTGYSMNYGNFSNSHTWNGSYGTWAFSNSGENVAEFRYNDSSGQYICTDMGGTSMNLASYSSYRKYVEPPTPMADLLRPLDMLLPAVKTPTCAPMLASNDSLPAAAIKVVLNLASANQTGLNGLIDTVQNACFGANFDGIIAAIKSLPAGATVVVPDALIEAYAGEAPDFEIVINKDELLAFAGQLELSKAFAQFAASYNFTYPIGAFLFDPGNPAINQDVDRDDIPDILETFMQNAKSPLDTSTGFLTDRSQAMRNASKATFITALGDLYTAATNISAELKKASGAYSDYGISADDIKSITDVLDTAAPEVSKVRTAIQSGNTYTYTAEIEDNGTTTTIDIVTDPDEIFASAIFSLDSLFSYSAGKPVPYTYTTFTPDSVGATYGEWSGEVAYNTSSGKTGIKGILLLKVRMDTLKKLWNNYADFTADEPKYFPAQLYAPCGYSDENVAVTDGYFQAVKWFFGF